MVCMYYLFYKLTYVFFVILLRCGKQLLCLSDERIPVKVEGMGDM